VTYTVLWVEQPQLHFEGIVSDTNTAQGNYVTLTDGKDVLLGFQNYTQPNGNHIVGWGYEAGAVVEPNNFDYPGVSDFQLTRDAHFRAYAGMLGDQEMNNYQPWDFSAKLPPGNDPSDPTLLDNNPKASGGMIYDLDAPWLTRAEAPYLNVMRGRWNFKEFGQIYIKEARAGLGGLVRCSPIETFFVRYSAFQDENPEGTNWKLLDPPDISGDNEVGLYSGAEPPVTWNLQ
jgi:hypothetical protein